MNRLAACSLSALPGPACDSRVRKRQVSDEDPEEAVSKT